MSQEFSSSSDRSWLSIEGHIKPLSNGAGSLHKLREKGHQFWFVLQDDSRLLYYNQRNSDSLPNVTPEGSFGVSSGQLDVFVVLTSNEGKEYLLSPANDVSFSDWLTNLKNKLNDKPLQSPFERGSQEQGGFMSRVRNSLRRKKKLGRSMSVDVTGQSRSIQISQAREEANTPFLTPELKHKIPEIISNKSRIERLQTYPFSGNLEDNNMNNTMEMNSKVKIFEDKACDTSSLVYLDWVITDGNEESTFDENTVRPVNVVEPRTQPRKLLKAVDIDYQIDRAVRGNLNACDTIQNVHGQTDTVKEKTDSYQWKGILSVNHNPLGRTDNTQRRGSLPVNQSYPRQTLVTQRKGSLPVNQSSPRQTLVTQRKGNLPVNQSCPRQTLITHRRASLPVNQSPGYSPINQMKGSLPVNQSRPGQTHTTQEETCSPRDSNSISKIEHVDNNTAASLETPQTSLSYSGKHGVDAEVEYKADMSSHKQKIIRELEIEVCKLKCEVISLIQGTIKVPLKDDDLADWHYVEEIRYKDRIFELLREARLYNPGLPDLDSSKSSNFKDSYGFIHGSRESESIVFHFVCRELTQHYSSFFQNKTGHVKFWNEYTREKKQNDDRILYKEKEIKRLVQDGIPSSCRSQVWKSFISEKVHSIIASKGANFYQKQAIKAGVKKNKLKSEMSEVERQIRCDLLRTMPSNENFKTMESEPVTQLSRILHAFADLRPDIGYLQGMNFLVGLFLLFMGEEDSFWSLYAVVDIYLKNYFDKFLSGVQADQEVLKDLVAEKLPALNAHLKYYGVDISTVTFNWFITVYLDAVPFETAVRIWDSFLFEGREVLFRIAIGLLKLQERSLLQLSGHLEIMQYMKRAARVMYDVDRLFKASFEEMTKFPTNDMLDERQRKYRTDTESKHKSPIKHETNRSRVSSFTVELPSQDKLDRIDRLDQHQIVECAITTSKDLSSPVCIPCSVRGDAKVYLLDIDKREMSTLETNINSRILCADVLADGTVLIGTVFWVVYAFDIDSKMELWSVPLRDSVIDLCHYDHVTDDKVYAALADGCIAVLPNANGTGPPSQGSHVRIGSAPVMCVMMVDTKVWCGCGNNVVVLDASSLEELHATVVSSSARHQVAHLIAGDHGVWCTIRGSSWVMLIDQDSYDFLLKIDAVSGSQVTVSPFQESRVTTVMPFSNELWVGLGNGQVLIFDLIENQIPGKEEDWVEKNDSSERDTALTEEGRKTQVDEIQSETASDPQYCQRTGISADKSSSEFKYSLKMRVQYRVSEEPIRALETLRENEYPMVLSCAATLSPEGGLSIWQKQATQDDLNEWMNIPIRHSTSDVKVSRVK